MAKKKYVKVKCVVCNKPTVLIPTGYEMGIPVICVACGEKNGKKHKKKATTTATATYARTKKGKRPDIHPTYSFRSGMEANFARILQHLDQEFKFEERVFTFEGYKNKPFVYIPDFEVKKKTKAKLKAGWYEIKGWMNPNSRSKLRRFKKHYPEEAKKLTVVISRKSDRAAKEFCDKQGLKTLYWDQLKKEYESKIPNWE